MPRRRSPPSDDRTVWLLGAGFSKPLGAPLFTELLSPNTGRWVAAWGSHHLIPPQARPSNAVEIYRRGLNVLWENAEECLALFEHARTDSIAQQVMVEAMGHFVQNERDALSRELSHFVAIATSFFVDRVSELRELPENWFPYQTWAQQLTDKDTILTFNYDRVVEELLKRTGTTPAGMHKLHGTVPEPKQLIKSIQSREPITSLYTPGPHKLAATRGPLKKEWEAAGAALGAADRLVIIGYSFPATDPFARSFILRHSEATRISVVVGVDTAGPEITAMFGRVHRIKPENTGLLAQQFLAEYGA